MWSTTTRSSCRPAGPRPPTICRSACWIPRRASRRSSWRLKESTLRDGTRWERSPWSDSARTLGRCEKMRPQAAVAKLKQAPPIQANDLAVVAQAVSPAYRILSQLLAERDQPDLLPRQVPRQRECLGPTGPVGLDGVAVDGRSGVRQPGLRRFARVDEIQQRDPLAIEC